MKEMRELLPLFLSSYRCHHRVAGAIISEFKAIIIMITTTAYDSFIVLLCSFHIEAHLSNHLFLIYDMQIGLAIHSQKVVFI